MTKDIHDRLMLAKERLRQKQKLDSTLRSQQAVLKEEQHKCRQHEQVLAAERADVEQLEGFTPQSSKRGLPRGTCDGFKRSLPTPTSGCTFLWGRSAVSRPLPLSSSTG